jgi:very-short-patch-repair endonuclease
MGVVFRLWRLLLLVGAETRADLSGQSLDQGRARGAQGPETGPSAPRTVALLDGRRTGTGSIESIDERIRAIAELQRARFTRTQLLALGVSRSAIKRRLHGGRLECVHHGVYALPHTADLPLAAETAALLACGEGAVLSHHSAITLWKLRPGTARPVHVTIPGARSGRRIEGVKVHRSTTLAPQDIALHDGLPVTSPARAILDAAPNLPDRDVERLLNEGLFALRILTLSQVNDVLARAGNHPGRARLARVVSSHCRSTQTDSPPEELLLELIRAAGLPEPDPQTTVLGYRLDFYWPALKLAVEVDAYGTHGSPARFEADRRRDARLLAEAGIVVVRFTRMAVEERPFEVIGVLARTIGQREALPSPRSRSVVMGSR